MGHPVEGIIFGFLSQYFANIFSSQKGDLSEEEQWPQRTISFQNYLISYTSDTPIEEHIGAWKEVKDTKSMYMR